MEIQKTDMLSAFSLYPTDKIKLIEEFSKPIHNNVFFNNLEILQQDSEFILFNVEKWNMRPEVFCQDKYNESHFYQVILLVNNIKSIFDFIPDNFVDRIILAPKYQQIIKLLGQTIYT
jgi:hypothetical protein